MISKNFQFFSLLFCSLIFGTGFFATGLSCARSAGGRSAYDIHNAVMSDNVVPLVIIGSGPAGLSAAVYGARGKIDTLVIEGNKPGGLLTETTSVENWPGETSILGPDIVKKMKAQALHLGARFLADAVESVDFSQWPFVIKTEGGQTIHAMAIVIATGAAPRRLNIPGENEYWGSGVTSCAVCDAPFFKGEEVVVIGGGDSAAEESMQLAPYVKHVTVLVRKDRMVAAPSMQDRMKGFSNLSVKYNLEPQEILGDGMRVTAIRLLDATNGEIIDMPIAGVFLAIGHNPNTGLFVDKLKLDKAGYIVLKPGRSQETLIPGVFAAGDVEDHSYRQAGVAAASGIKAALDAARFLTEIGLNDEVVAQLQDNTFRGPQEVVHGKVISIKNMEDFNTLINSSTGTIIFDFFAEYCPSCMQMLPAFESAAGDFAGKALFAKVDADEATDVVEKLFVHKVPCIIVFKNGQLVAKYNDVMSKKELATFIEQFV